MMKFSDVQPESPGSKMKGRLDDICLKRNLLVILDFCFKSIAKVDLPCVHLTLPILTSALAELLKL